MMLRNKLDAFFYMAYRFQLAVGNSASEIIMMTYFGVAFVFKFNLICFLIIFSLITGTNIILVDYTFSAILVCILVYSTVYIFYIKGKRYNRIIENYEASNKKYNIKRSNFIMIGIILLTLLNIYGSLYLLYISR